MLNNNNRTFATRFLFFFFLLLSVIAYLELFQVNYTTFSAFIKYSIIIRYSNLVVLKLIIKLHYQLWLNKVTIERYDIVEKY